MLDRVPALGVLAEVEVGTHLAKVERVHVPQLQSTFSAGTTLIPKGIESADGRLFDVPADLGEFSHRNTRTCTVVGSNALVPMINAIIRGSTTLFILGKGIRYFRVKIVKTAKATSSADDATFAIVKHHAPPSAIMAFFIMESVQVALP